MQYTSTGEAFGTFLAGNAHQRLSSMRRKSGRETVAHPIYTLAENQPEEEYPCVTCLSR